MKHRRAIAGAVTDQRHGFDAKGCPDQFARFTVGHGLAGIVHNFEVQEFGMNMPARAWLRIRTPNWPVR